MSVGERTSSGSETFGSASTKFTVSERAGFIGWNEKFPIQKSGKLLSKCISHLSTSMIIFRLRLKKQPGVQGSDIAAYGLVKKSGVGNTICRKDSRQSGQRS